MHCYHHINLDKAKASLGTLGGGNHFIEIDKSEDGNFYLTVHSGSRHLGVEVTEHYLREGKKLLVGQGIKVDYPLTWLEGGLMQDYLADVALVQQYAALNRQIILQEVMKGAKLKGELFATSVHNYVENVDGGTLLLRKGAISANAGEQVIIPVNMQEGIILGKRKGMCRLQTILLAQQKANLDKQNNEAWSVHNGIERGNPIRVYEGEKFKRVK